MISRDAETPYLWGDPHFEIQNAKLKTLPVFFLNYFYLRKYLLPKQNLLIIFLLLLLFIYLYGASTPKGAEAPTSSLVTIGSVK